MSEHKQQYDQLIETARIESVKYMRGFVIHHIVPKCLGGGDEPSNLVRLTREEHLRAHWLLSKFLIGTERRKMELVFEKMLMEKRGKSYADKSTYRRDARDDAARLAAVKPSADRRKELSLAASKFLASEWTRNGRRGLSN
jgi:hypothetical protein